MATLVALSTLLVVNSALKSIAVPIVEDSAEEWLMEFSQAAREFMKGECEFEDIFNDNTCDTTTMYINIDGRAKMKPEKIKKKVNLMRSKFKECVRFECTVDMEQTLFPTYTLFANCEGEIVFNKPVFGGETTVTNTAQRIFYFNRQGRLINVEVNSKDQKFSNIVGVVDGVIGAIESFDSSEDEDKEFSPTVNLFGIIKVNKLDAALITVFSLAIIIIFGILMYLVNKINKIYNHSNNHHIDKFVSE